MRDFLLTLPQICLCNGNCFFWQHDYVSVIGNKLSPERCLPVINLESMLMLFFLPCMKVKSDNDQPRIGWKMRSAMKTFPLVIGEDVWGWLDFSLVIFGSEKTNKEKTHKQIVYGVVPGLLGGFSLCVFSLYQNNPRAHKNQIGTPPSQTQNTRPPGGILWTWRFLQKERRNSRHP